MTAMIPGIRDRRILGGIRIVDASTGEMVTAPLTLSADRLSFKRNRSGIFAVIGIAPGTVEEAALAKHITAFATPPAQPDPGSVNFTVTVSDPRQTYIPRRFTLDLPRGENWHLPIDVALHPTPAAPVGPNWSGLRASLNRQEGEDSVPLAGARLTIIRDSDDKVLGRGFADRRGEVLAIAVGIPVIDFTAPAIPAANGDGNGDGNGNGNDGGNGGAPPPAAVGAKTIATRIEIHTGPGDPWPPDPAAIEANGKTWVPVDGALPTPELRTGRLETAGLNLLLQPQA